MPLGRKISTERSSRSCIKTGKVCDTLQSNLSDKSEETLLLCCGIFGTSLGTSLLATTLWVYVTVRGPAKRCDWLEKPSQPRIKTPFSFYEDEDQWRNLGRWVYGHAVWLITPVIVCLRSVFFATLLKIFYLRCSELLTVYFGWHVMY